MRSSATRSRILSAIVVAFTFIFIGTAVAQDAANLVVMGDIVIGREGLAEEELSSTCTLTSRFEHEQQVVWRIKVIDPVTGAELTDEDLDSVEVLLVDGQVFEMEFGEHPPRDPVDAYWTVNWVIPADFPSGIVDYTIEARASDGRVGELVTFPLDASWLTIIDE